MSPAACLTSTLFVTFAYELHSNNIDQDSIGAKLTFGSQKTSKTSKGGARTLLGAKGIATRSKDATRGSWPYY